MTNETQRRPGMVLPVAMLAIYGVAFVAYVMMLTSVGAQLGPFEVLMIGALFLVLCFGLTRAILANAR